MGFTHDNVIFTIVLEFLTHAEVYVVANLDEIEKGRYDVCAKEDTSLQQLIDNIVEIYLRTIYKLKFLA